jgi:hypothetical protein
MHGPNSPHAVLALPHCHTRYSLTAIEPADTGQVPASVQRQRLRDWTGVSRCTCEESEIHTGRHHKPVWT